MECPKCQKIIAPKKCICKSCLSRVYDYECDTCEITFRTVNNIIIHMGKAAAVSPYNMTRGRLW
jgi:hypothetical protein